MLTPRQHQTLTFISQSIDERGFAPSLEELCSQLGFASKSNPQRIITILVDKGYLRRSGGHARALEVVKAPATDPDAMSPAEMQSALVAAIGRIAALERQLAAMGSRAAA